ncbi:IMP cyclohydrolase [Candidatus Woesearchaeota archaeon]|nr:IMP cyclohydrolase [Candidatus Woesearchaeota archaeon]
MAEDLKQAYRTIMDDHFPRQMEISFVDGDKRQTLFYEKKAWVIGDTEKGLRYGENPGQEAALYKLVNGNLVLGDIQCIQSGRYLASDVELLQSGKHPGKTNITDTDNALNILRYLKDTPACVILKHNNPCGAAYGATLAEAYDRANMADRLAAFGGAIGLNRECDIDTANLIAQNYAEVVVAPEFAEGVMDIFAKKKNLRVFRIGNMARLQEYDGQRVVDFKSLIDGGLVAQWSFVPKSRIKEDLTPAQTTYKDKEYKIARLPTDKEYEDLLFGWMVEAGVTSNSVLYVKDGVTVGIGTGEQDRVGVAEIARDKAYRKLKDRICWEKYGIPFNELFSEFKRIKSDKTATIEERVAVEEKYMGVRDAVQAENGGLRGAVMVSDAFFPFRDGVDVGIREGITAIIQPGGSDRDFESIEACNESNVAMVYTGQRSFKH